MAEQVSVFVENKPGRLTKVTGALAAGNINIRALLIQDRGTFGVIKMLVSDPKKAHLALVEAGFACALREIIAVEVADRPGGLHQLCKAFLDNDINIIDAYGFVIEPRQKAIWCVEVENLEKTQNVVEDNGFKVLSECELYEP